MKTLSTLGICLALITPALGQNPPPVGPPPAAPVVNWATYYGGIDGEFEGYVATDAQANAILATTVFPGSVGLATVGSFQETPAGNFDVCIAKFDPAGTRLWATYFGGSGYEQVAAVATDLQGYIYITGTTNSFSGIATIGSFQERMFSDSLNRSGGFLTKFSPDGQLMWSTYFDGRKDDLPSCLATRPDGTVLIGGATKSDSLATSGTFQPSAPHVIPGWYAGFIANFSSTGARNWSTYIGGFEGNWVHALSILEDGRIFATGEGRSSNLSTPNAYKPTRNSWADGFLMCLDSTGNRLWATYVGGDDGDAGQALALDKRGNIYLAGSTTSITELTTPGCYQPDPVAYTFVPHRPNSYLAKFTTQGEVQWVTYLGDSADVLSIACDTSGDLYATGGTLSPYNIISPGSLRQHSAGFGDAFLVRLSPNGLLKYGTFLGTDGTDAGYGITISQNNILYISGGGDGADSLATAGAFQEHLGSSGIPDAFLVQLNPAALTATRPLVAASLQAYPSPTDGPLKIRSQSAEPFQLWSTDGRLLREQSAAKGQTLSLDLSAYPSGIYLLQQGAARQRVVRR